MERVERIYEKFYKLKYSFLQFKAAADNYFLPDISEMYALFGIGNIYMHIDSKIQDESVSEYFENFKEGVLHNFHQIKEGVEFKEYFRVEYEKHLVQEFNKCNSFNSIIRIEYLIKLFFAYPLKDISEVYTASLNCLIETYYSTSFSKEYGCNIVVLMESLIDWAAYGDFFPIDSNRICEPLSKIFSIYESTETIDDVQKKNYLVKLIDFLATIGDKEAYKILVLHVDYPNDYIKKLIRRILAKFP